MNYDIAIIGGGMVGAALACALNDTPMQVVLIDAAPLHHGEDSRLIALNETSIALFKKLNLWQELKSYAESIEQIHVSHRGRFGITRIDCQELNMQELGCVVPAKYINAALYSALNQMKNIQLIRPATLQSLQQDEHQNTLEIMLGSIKKTLTAKMVIGADGSFSTVRELLNIPVEKVDYQQSALVTTTLLQRSHCHIAYERFLKEGAIAMLPLSPQRVATIWTAPNAKIAYLMQLNEQGFLAELQHEFGYRLGRLMAIEKRATYPLHMLIAKQLRQQNVLLLGNAAHTMHPIAAQGLNLALKEVTILANYLQQSSPDSLSLKFFPEDRFKERFNQKLSHHLTWLFSTDLFMLNTLRQVGMVALDVLPGLKKRFALLAMGKNKN